MAVTIVNPARFNDDGLGTRRFIRGAFFDEGYGVSNSFKAYAQGAGIVPATAAFDGIGAGTAGDPLRMSQFSGFTVPSLALETQTLTVSDRDGTTYYGEYIQDYDYNFSHGYVAYSLGSISPGSSTIYSNASWYAMEYFNTTGVHPGAPTFYISVRRLNAYGAIPNSGWTTLTLNDALQGIHTYNRASLSFSSGSNGGYQYGTWVQYSAPDPFFDDAFHPINDHSATATFI